MANQWCRLHAEMLNDPKVQTLPDAAFKAWVNAMCLATTLDRKGELGTLNDVSFAFRMSEEAVSYAFQQLVARGLIVTKDETFHIAKWHKRQFKSDTSTERVRRHRNARRNVTVTPPETETETETEQKKSNAVLQPLPSSQPKPKKTPKAYSEAFEAFWVDWLSVKGGGDKSPAFDAWKKLTQADRMNAHTVAVPWFHSWRAQNRDASAIHASTYLKKRRFDGFDPARSAASTSPRLETTAQRRLREASEQEALNGQ